MQASGVQSRLEVAAARGLTPLVGRVPEVGLLVERWARVKEGMGQVVVLEGEAGIGKSRLVQVLKDHIAGEAHTCLEWRGSPYTSTPPGIPSPTLPTLAPWRPGEAPGATLAEARGAPGAGAAGADRDGAPVAELIALPLPAGAIPPGH